MPTFSRRTSEYRQSKPGGLYLPMHAGLKGRVRWQVLDERGVPEVPRNRSGFAIGPAGGVEQDNLITDHGLNRLAELDALRAESISSPTQLWRYRLAVGTGTTEPSVSDTTLANEVQRSTSVGTFSPGSELYELDTENDVWRATCMVTRLATMTEDRNLTEFGFAQNASDDIFIRELLRDSGGDPVSVSLLEGKSLRVDHTLIIEIDAPPEGHLSTIDIEEYDAGNNYIGSTPYQIRYGMSVRTPGNSTSYRALFEAWSPWRNLPATSGQGTRPAPYTEYNRAVEFHSGSGLATPSQTYVSGSFQRSKRVLIPAGTYNQEWTSYMMTYTGSQAQYGGLVVVFVDPPSYTKQSTDTLLVGMISSWGRA